MVNISYTETSGDMMYYPDDGSTPVLYNLGDIAWSKSQSFLEERRRKRKLTHLTFYPVIAATALVWIMIPGVGLVSLECILR